MNDNIRVVNRYTVPPGQSDEVKNILTKLIERVQTEDSGTLSYEWYFNEDESEMFVLARWRDSEALIEHEALFAKSFLAEEFHKKAPVNRVEAFGKLSDELAKLFPEVKALNHWKGFTR